LYVDLLCRMTIEFPESYGTGAGNVQHCGIDSGIGINSNSIRFRSRWEFRAISSDYLSIQFPEFRSGMARLFQGSIFNHNVKRDGESGRRFRCGIPSSLVILAIPDSHRISRNCLNRFRDFYELVELIPQYSTSRNRMYSHQQLEK
jgi:hypothetical protein